MKRSRSNRLTTLFMNLSTRKKLLLCFGSLTAVLTIGIGLFSYFAASRIIFRQTLEQSQETMQELSLNIDNYYNLVRNSFVYIANSTDVQSVLNSEEAVYSSGQSAYSYYSVQGRIRRLLLQGYSSVYMKDIELYGYNGTDYFLALNGETTAKDQEEIFTLAEQANGECIIYNDDRGDTVQVIKLVRDMLTMKPLGVLRASLKTEYLDQMTEQVKLATNGSVYILDKDKKAVTKDPGIYEKSFLEGIQGSKGSFMYQVQGNKYCVVYRLGSETGFYVVGMIPMEYLSKTLADYRNITYSIILLGIVVNMIFASILAKILVAPISETSNAMKKFADGDFSIRLADDRKDEIGVMNHVFNDTIMQVETLLKELVQAEALEKELEFKALQAQINPHFLYNVLDTINWMARKKGEEQICHMVTSISHLLRGSIGNKRNMVTLKEELEYVGDYIYIQQTRYGDRFTTQIQMERSLEKHLIPKLTLQPLIENAIVHGVENADWKCELFVDAEKKGDEIYITIKDTGVGIREEKLKNILKGPEGEDDSMMDRSHTSLGLYAVHRRLQFVYGEEYGLTVMSKENEGTTIVIRIPLQINNKREEEKE